MTIFSLKYIKITRSHTIIIAISYLSKCVQNESERDLCQENWNLYIEKFALYLLFNGKREFFSIEQIFFCGIIQSACCPSSAVSSKYFVLTKQLKDNEKNYSILNWSCSSSVFSSNISFCCVHPNTNVFQKRIEICRK